MKLHGVFSTIILFSIFLLSAPSIFAQDIFNGNVFLDHNGDAVKNGLDYNHPVMNIKAFDDTNNNSTWDGTDLLIDADLTDVNGDYSLTLDVLSPTISKSVYVATGNDDAEENSGTGGVGLTSSDLELTDEGGSTNQIIGIRFSGIAIPAGVNITNAYLEFEAKANNSGTCDLTIKAEKNISSAAFQSANGNISSRTTTTDSVNWSPSGWSTGNTYTTPDLTSLIDELNGMSGWSSDSPVTFIVTGSGEREAWSANGSGTAPRLVVEYDNPFLGNRYFLVLEESEMVTGSEITLPVSDYYTYNSGLGTTNNVDFAFRGETVLCYGMSDGGANSGLSAMNRMTGENFLIGLSGETDIEAACFDPYTVKFYAAAADQLGEVNRTTGVFTATSSTFGTGNSVLLGASEQFNDVDGLAFDPLTGILWGTERKTGWDALFQIDPSTGEYIPDAFGSGEDYVLVKDAGDLLPGDIDDIGINPEDGKLYGIANNATDDILVVIDKTTGIATAIDTLKKSDGNNVQDVEGFGFTNFGLLLAVTGNTSTVDDTQWTVDLTTGRVTLVGTYNYGEDYESCDCLTAALNNVSGTVFNDVNGDGLIDVGDNGLQNVTVYIYIDDNNDSRISGGDILLDSIETDVNGDWSYEIASNVDMLFSIDENDLPGGSKMTTNNLEMAYLDDALGGTTDTGNNFGYNSSGPDTDKDGIADINDIDDDNDGIPDVIENYSADHDDDGTPDSEDADFCTANFEGVNGWSCSNGLPDPSNDLDSDGTANFEDSDFPNCGGLNVFGICTNFDKDMDGVPDHIDLDADNDGIADLVEIKGIDTDGDGRVDVNTDIDGDGLADIFDNNDTDGPTGDMSDMVNPSTSALLDTDSDGTTDTGDTDGDNLPDYIDLDADNDGIPDLVEAEGIDTNGDGRVDTYIDDDGDGYTDTYDSDEDDAAGDEDGGTPLVETDGSGNLLDGLTSNSKDTDGDGLADHLDLDVDNDGIPDMVESGAADPDDDGKVDTGALPWDADGDGLADIFDQNASDGPSGSGVNGTALIKTTSDSNADQRINSSESMVNGGSNNINYDSDAYPNHLDLDADNDGITDVVENASGYVTADHSSGTLDGIVGDSPTVTDANNDGWHDPSNSNTTDTDGDGIADYLDIDADNDGIPDYLEGVCSTCPTFTTPTGSDSDGDGVLDMYENLTAANANSGSNTGTTPNEDNDDGTNPPDYLDTDTDNDTAFDWTEGYDLDNDGVAFDDIMGMATDYETATSNGYYNNGLDTDGDGLPDYLDNQPSVNGYDENARPPFLDSSSPFWHDPNANGLVAIFDTNESGTNAPTPDNNAVDDRDWRDMSTVVALPVELLSFTATLSDCEVVLEWWTGSEERFSHYEIERSQNGFQFQKLSAITAQGGERSQSYNFLDEHSEEMNYYRLKMVNLDGSFEYSAIVSVANTCTYSETKLSIFPNPVNYYIQEVNLKWDHEIGEVEISIINQYGQVLSIDRAVVNGRATNVDIHNLPTGIFYLVVKEGGKTETVKFMRIE